MELPPFPQQQEQDNQNQQQSEPASTESDLYNGFLNNIPEQDRGIVAKYAKDWDGNVTRKMQEIHEQYKPYKELGDVDKIQTALTLMDRFDTMPLEVYKLFHESLAQRYGEDFADKLWEDQMNDDVEYEYVDEDGNPVDPADLDDYEVVENSGINDTLQQYGATIEDLQNWKNAQEQQAREAQENAELDGMLKNMHTTFLEGYKLDEDDNDWLLVQLAKNRTPEQAAEAWKKKFGGQQSPRLAPRILAGQGGVANDQVDLAKLRGAGRRKMVADILSQANQ